MALEFTLTLASEQVTLDGRAYTIRELTGKAREAYTTMQLAATSGDRVTSADGLVCGLVALSLFDSDGKPVPRSVVDSWPGRVVDALADRARVLSGLAGAEGNDSGASAEAGSA